LALPLPTYKLAAILETDEELDTFKTKIAELEKFDRELLSWFADCFLTPDARNHFDLTKEGQHGLSENDLRAFTSYGEEISVREQRRIERTSLKGITTKRNGFQTSPERMLVATLLSQEKALESARKGTGEDRALNLHRILRNLLVETLLE